VCFLCYTARLGVVVPTQRMRSTVVSYGRMAIKRTGNKEMSIFEPAARHSLWSDNHVTVWRADTEHTVGSKQQKCVV